MAGGDAEAAAAVAADAGDRLRRRHAQRSSLLRRGPEDRRPGSAAVNATMRAIITVAAAVLAAVVLALSPVTLGADARRAVAVGTVKAGFASIGARLLIPLAQAGDAVAQNDLGVL